MLGVGLAAGMVNLVLFSVGEGSDVDAIILRFGRIQREEEIV